MPTNEAGPSGANNPGEGNRQPPKPQGSTKDDPGKGAEEIADQTGGGRAGLVPEEAVRGEQPPE